MKARQYISGLGVFGGVDPLADHTSQVDKSPYAYAWNNPVNLTDPTGMMPECDGCPPTEAFSQRAHQALAKAGEGASKILDAFSGSVSVKGKLLGGSVKARIGPVQVKATLTGLTGTISQGSDGTTVKATALDGALSATFGPGDSASATTAGISAKGTLVEASMNSQDMALDVGVGTPKISANGNLGDAASGISLSNSGKVGGSVGVSIVKVGGSVDLGKVSEGVGDMVQALGDFLTGN
jgi:hypothetical protein